MRHYSLEAIREGVTQLQVSVKAGPTLVTSKTRQVRVARVEALQLLGVLA